MDAGDELLPGLLGARDEADESREEGPEAFQGVESDKGVVKFRKVEIKPL